jgi:hypothetical protein
MQGFGHAIWIKPGGPAFDKLVQNFAAFLKTRPFAPHVAVQSHMSFDAAVDRAFKIAATTAPFPITVAHRMRITEENGFCALEAAAQGDKLQKLCRESDNPYPPHMSLAFWRSDGDRAVHKLLRAADVPLFDTHFFSAKSLAVVDCRSSQPDRWEVKSEFSLGEWTPRRC